MTTLGANPAGEETIHVLCPTCGAKYVLPEYREGQRFACKRCSASLLFGKFALMMELGRGGFGVVYKAWQADLHRTVALKFLQSDSEESTERFIREARIAANLSHPNITPIYEVGTHEGKLYITMLFVDGTTTNKTKFSIREAAEVIRDAALAVDYAHARAIIHRDIKPHNIMVTREEASGTNPGELSRRVYVMDFGLARSVGKGGTLTTEGQILGTPAFMSPEQAEGKTLDARSDIYSLGATLYSLVTHRAPFEANTPVQVLMLVATGTPTRPSQHNPELDPNLEGIILKAMSRKTEDRYPTAARLAQDLNRYLQGVVTDAGPTVHISSKSLPSAAAQAAGEKKKSRALPLAVGILLILIGAAGLLKMFAFPGKKGTADPGSSPPGQTVQENRNSPPGHAAPGAKVVLRVRTDPPGARVKVGSLDPKESPCEFKDSELALGDYDLSITLSTYDRVDRPVKIGEGPVVDLEMKLFKAKRAVAFRLLSTPPGAKVLMEGADIGHPTPVSVYRDQIPSGKDRVTVVLELRNFERKFAEIELLGTEHDETILLDPMTGTLLVREAAPRSRLHLFAFPEGLSARNPRALCSLWSENADQIEKALQTMDPEDATLVADRLKALGGHEEARIRDQASKLAVAKAPPLQLKPEVSIAADGAGNAVLDKAWVANRYRLLATAPAMSDFVSEELQPLHREETRVKVFMTAIASVTAKVSPLVGHFLLKYGDGTSPLKIVPGAQAVRIPSGPVTLRFIPPPGDPFLREFVLPETAVDRLEITGNLYLMSARAIEKQDPAQAVRIYTKLLGEDSWPKSENEERNRLPALVTAMIRALIAKAEEAGASVGDPAQALETAAKKPPAEKLGPLLEVWCAKNTPRAARAGAASELALAHAQLKHPYESMEWLERAVALGMDPGGDNEGAVAAAVKGYPGLAERQAAVSKALAGIRTPPSARNSGFLGLRVVEVVGRGVRVDAVARGGPAEGAGLQFGDFLSELGGASLKVPSDLDQALKAMAEGDEVVLRFERAGEKKAVKIRLGTVPAAVDYPAVPVGPAPATKVGVLQAVLAQIGHIVKLEAGAEVKTGDALQIVRNGEVVAELLVTRITKPDSSYPNGSAVCKATRGTGQKGDEVRRKP